jgi:hypothetical protein
VTALPPNTFGARPSWIWQIPGDPVVQPPVFIRGSRRSGGRNGGGKEVTAMAEINNETRVFQAPGVYTTPLDQQVHILYGGNDGTPDGPEHGHYIYGIPSDRVIKDIPPGPRS